MLENLFDFFQNLREAMQREKAKGFAQAVICTDEAEGIAVLVQSSGVGALRPNTVVVGWPNSWRRDRNNQNYYNFLGEASIYPENACFFFHLPANMLRNLKTVIRLLPSVKLILQLFNADHGSRKLA